MCFDPKYSCIVFITVLLCVVQVLLLSSFYSQVRYHFCLLPTLPDESLPYKWLWILHYVFRNGREMCFFSAKVTEMPSVLCTKWLCRVSAELKKKLTLCFLLLLRILNYSICSLTLIICLLSTFFSLSLSLFLSFSFDCTNTIADLILLACYLLAVSVLGHQTLWGGWLFEVLVVLW